VIALRIARKLVRALAGRIDDAIDRRLAAQRWRRP
jgi:hypothetical protein